ncbi:hypothetical protein H310_04418 [Aphanomyces invadans]|uniref:Uncharacterized protein n=1 Tax=Aphanomyces invadans TaxID=157072 RepID=A0A024UC95_9STRA|nr:hypothetical protein H310_04418 [Aphanomyces invadans]ETW04031.1 hypothetical protein H310_04418 [Aphanomyces invadans]|eukprot:XP_008866987.1 hypothetical protein H310_04418 [Aphanomyces invadans]
MYRTMPSTATATVLASRELVQCVFAYQCGLYEDMLPLSDLLPKHLTNRALYFLMIGNFSEFCNHIGHFATGIAPWLAKHGTRGLSRLFACIDSMSFTVELFAACVGHIDVIDFMLDNDLLDPTIPLMDLAAWAGQLTVMTHLTERNRCKDSKHCTMTTTTLDWAACNGQLNVVQYFTEVEFSPCSTEAMDGAARCGHLEIVQYLHTKRREGCTPGAMDRAACYGYLDVVEYLHENRHEGCTYRAMDAAATSGHLEIVQFLNEWRDEGASSDAMDGAILNGHLSVVKYLLDHTSVATSSADVLDAALALGDPDMAAFLLDRFCLDDEGTWSGDDDPCEASAIQAHVF